MRSAVFFFFIYVAFLKCAFAKESYLPALEEKFTEYAGYVSNRLQNFNDEHLGKTELGRFLHYDEMKTKLVENENPTEGRSMKKMSMAMMPLIFHIGATSTWMLLTTVLTAKSLMVGLALLVFKIAVSSAKLAAFFTHLKIRKHGHGHGHHDWAPAWLPHYDHHEKHIEHHPEHHGTIIHHTPEWTPNDTPHHFHEYKNNDFHDFKNDFHDFTHNEIHDFKNNEFHNFNTHGFNDYKTIPHDFHGFNDGFHGDFNHFEGAKKKIDSKVG